MELMRSVLRCRKGTAGVEAALLLPVLITMLLGLVEMSKYIEAAQRAMSAAQSVADLVTQDVTHTDASLAEIRTAARLVMAPLPTGNADLSIMIVSVGFDDQDGTPFVLWQDPYAGTVTADPNRATDLGDPGESVIMVTMTYNYDSPFGFLFEGRTLTEEAFSRPRITSRIALNGKTDHEL